jgi:hypothetical protein
MGVGVHGAERDDFDERGPRLCDSGEGVDLYGLIDAEEDQLVIDYGEVGSSVRVFDGGLALQQRTVVQR